MDVTLHVSARGRDKFGAFTILTGPCPSCGDGDLHLVVMYDEGRIELPSRINHEDVLLGQHNALCIDNGCYAKAHRQIAHIEDSMRVRALNSVR